MCFYDIMIPNFERKVMDLRELKAKIMEAMVSTLPITVIVYVLSLTPLFDFSVIELITFTVGAVLLVLPRSRRCGFSRAFAAW